MISYHHCHSDLRLSGSLTNGNRFTCNPSTTYIQSCIFDWTSKQPPDLTRSLHWSVATSAACKQQTLTFAGHLEYWCNPELVADAIGFCVILLAFFNCLIDLIGKWYFFDVEWKGQVMQQQSSGVFSGHHDYLKFIITQPTMSLARRERCPMKTKSLKRITNSECDAPFVYSLASTTL